LVSYLRNHFLIPNHKDLHLSDWVSLYAVSTMEGAGIEAKVPIPAQDLPRLVV
jgi:hypothetical protein